MTKYLVKAADNALWSKDLERYLQQGEVVELQMVSPGLVDQGLLEVVPESVETKKRSAEVKDGTNNRRD